MVDEEKIYHLIALKKTSLALKLLLVEISNDPTNSHLYFLAGLCYSIDSDFVKAKSFLNKSLELNPTNIDAFSQLATIALFEEEYEIVEELSLQSISIDPFQEIAYIILANKYLKTLELEKCYTNYHLALNINPKSQKAKILLAEYYLFKQEFQKSLSLIHEVLRVDPNNSYALLTLSRYLGNIGSVNEAREMLLSSIKNSPDNRNLRNAAKQTFISQTRLFKNFFKKFNYNLLKDPSELYRQQYIIWFFSFAIGIIIGICNYTLFTEIILFLVLTNASLTITRVLFAIHFSNLVLQKDALGKMLLEKDEIFKAQMILICYLISAVLVIIGAFQFLRNFETLSLINLGLFFLFVPFIVNTLQKVKSTSIQQFIVILLTITTLLFSPYVYGVRPILFSTIINLLVLLTILLIAKFRKRTYKF